MYEKNNKKINAKKWFKTFYWIIKVKFLCSLHNSSGDDFMNHLNIT